MTNLDDLRKHVTTLSDESLLEVEPEDLTPEAAEVYAAELESRGLAWPAEDQEQEESIPLASDSPETQLVLIGRFESFDEARYAQALLRQEGIPVWLAGATTPGKIVIDPNAPLDLVTRPEFLEQAQLVLSTEVSEEDLARQAEEAGQEG